MLEQKEPLFTEPCWRFDSNTKRIYAIGSGERIKIAEVIMNRVVGISFEQMCANGSLFAEAPLMYRLIRDLLEARQNNGLDDKINYR